MTYPTALDGPGIFSLERVQLFFEKMKLDLSMVIIKQEYFELYTECHTDYQQFYDFVQQTKLCPVIRAEEIASNYWHAMVVDKAIQHGSQCYFQCKNTYKAKPQVFVGHLSLPKIEFTPFDAIVISFARTQ